MKSPSARLFTTSRFSGRGLYRLYSSLFAAGALSLLYYRFTHVPPARRLPWLLVSLAEAWFSAMWLFQQPFRWNLTRHVTHPERLPADLPHVDVMVCTADPDREPPMVVADTLLSLMAYDYDAGKLAFYLSDDGGSELTFHAAYQASVFARDWLPFCRKYEPELRAPKAFFGSKDTATCGGDSGNFRRDYAIVKQKFEEMQARINRTLENGEVPEDTRKRHKGFGEWRTNINRIDHQSIVEILLRGGPKGDRDAEGRPMSMLVYMSREKRPSHSHNFKAGALNSLNRVSALMSNAPFILNVDCDMHSNNSQTLQHTMCFFLDAEQGHRIGFVQFPQCFGGVTPNDLYSTSLLRVNEIEQYGLNGYNGPPYSGTGAIHRRESLSGRKFMPHYQPKWNEKLVYGEVDEWIKLEAEAKVVSSCAYEQGKPWGKEMGLLYGCPVEDVYTGLALHSRGWQSVHFNPGRKSFLGMAPQNTNDYLIQYKRWASGLFEIFLSGLCPMMSTHGFGRLKMGQIMCYSFYTLWATWSLPTLCYAVLPPLAMVNGIPLFPKVSDPWFKLFVLLAIASHAYSLGELIWVKGTGKVWLNETRMWMMRSVSSFVTALLVVALKHLGISESGFEITNKVIDLEAHRRYKQEVMEFAVPSPMFLVPATLSLLNLWCFLKSAALTIARAGSITVDGMALQMMLSGYISLMSLPLYVAMFWRRDRGRMPTSITACSAVLVFSLLYLSSHFIY